MVSEFNGNRRIIGPVPCFHLIQEAYFHEKIYRIPFAYPSLGRMGAIGDSAKNVSSFTQAKRYLSDALLSQHCMTVMLRCQLFSGFCIFLPSDPSTLPCRAFLANVPVSSSIVYHRLIYSSLSVGAMLWSMAQLRRGQLRMVVDVPVCMLTCPNHLKSETLYY